MSNVIFNDHINVKGDKRWSLGDNYFNKTWSQSELTLMGVRQNKNFGIKVIQKRGSSRDTVAGGHVLSLIHI